MRQLLTIRHYASCDPSSIAAAARSNASVASVNALPTIIHSAILVDHSRRVTDAWVCLDGGIVTHAGRGDGWRELSAAPTADVVDATGLFLAPGFIDLHAHGGNGAAFDDGADAIARALVVHRRSGTTRSVLSLVTASIEDLAARVADIARLAASDPSILGSHLEGPFLDPGHKGAHTESLLRPADASSIEHLIEAAAGTLRQVTIAPERPGAHDAIARFAESGARVAVGHTDADYDQTRAAFDAGASILTHTFNAMHGLQHRSPGPVAAAFDDERVTLELIADGVHVHPRMLRLAFDEAPGRVALVTDAMAAAGAADGRYSLGGLAVDVRDGVARLTDGGAIAGSTLTQDEALRVMTRDAGVSVEVAVEALTATPARALGRENDLGHLGVGFAADAVLLDESLQVAAVWVAGTRV
jgi:N-acetylglucosamine-6-phosphate deacetylase